MTDYVDLTDDEQVEALRPVARAAAAEFGLDLAALELVAHEFNTTFAAVAPDGERHALRVHTNSVSTTANVVAQQSWQHDIAVGTDVLVPVPLRTMHDDWYTAIESAAVGRALEVTAATWLDGPDVGDVDAATAHALGRTMAQLHRHAMGWAAPPRSEMPALDDPLFGDEDRLDAAPGLSSEARAVIERAREATADTFASVHAGATLRPVHADLHGGNLKWSGDRLAVFDFDDSGLGLPVVDLAVTTFYLRGGDPTLERALRDGYADVAPVPEVEPQHFEALVAARQLLLANSLLVSTTAQLQREASHYLTVTVDRLRQWLETGTFTRVVSPH